MDPPGTGANDYSTAFGRRRQVAGAPGRARSDRGRQEFVALDAGGDAAAPVLLLDAHHLPEAADVDVASLGDFLGQCQDELDLVAWLHAGFDHKVQPAKTDVAGLPALLNRAVPAGGAHQQWQVHCEAPRCAALNSISHRSPGRAFQVAPKLASKPAKRNENCGRRASARASGAIRARTGAAYSRLCGSAQPRRFALTQPRAATKMAQSQQRCRSRPAWRPPASKNCGGTLVRT